jgi:hypothetical protein
MFTWYWKTLLTALVLLGWLWSLSMCGTLLSARSDLGVVLGVVGFLTATFSAIGLMGLIYRKRAKSNAKVTSGSTGGGI